MIQKLTGHIRECHDEVEAETATADTLSEFYCFERRLTERVRHSTNDSSRGSAIDPDSIIVQQSVAGHKDLEVVRQPSTVLGI
jgi:hypothetical protein